MKKTRLGYQFDHNVYIGYQINDNRVVTIKELENVANIAAAASGGVANITLSTSALTEAPSNVELDQIDFNNNGTITHEKIVPGYLVPGTTIPEEAKLCVIAPAGDGKAYRVYVSDKSISDIPTQYLKGAAVSSDGNTLTLTKEDNTTVTFTDDDHYPTTFSWYFVEGDLKGQLSGPNFTTVNSYTVPEASATHSGVVGIGAQTFKGEKTIDGNGHTPLTLIQNSNGDYFLKIKDGNNYLQFNNDTLTATRDYTWPDKSGTVLLDADVTNAVTSGSTSVVTSGAVYQAIADLPEPMIFKGTVGDTGDSPTITWANLPAASGHEGYTYKVVTDHTSTPVCEAGDTIISNGSAWVVIPSGDEPSGTVTSVGITPQSDSHLTSTGGPITSAGSITIGIDSGYSIPSNSNQAAWSKKMVYKTTVGPSGSGAANTDLPSNAQQGDVYSVIAAGNYHITTATTQAAVAGDLFIRGDNVWYYVPSGDHEYQGTASVSDLNTLTANTSNKEDLKGRIYRLSDSGQLNYYSGTMAVSAGEVVIFDSRVTGSGNTWGWAVCRPGEYLKSASVSGNTLTLTPQNGSAINYTPTFTDTNTWRDIKVNGTQLLGTGISTGALNLKNSTYITATGSGNDVSFSPNNLVTTDTTQTISGTKTFGALSTDGTTTSFIREYGFSPVELTFNNSENAFLTVYDTDSNYHIEFDTGNGLTDNRTYSYPNKSGTIALTSDIPTDTDTYRPIQINGTQFLSNATSSGYANLKAGSNISVTGSNSHDITIAATNVVTTNTQQTITGQKTFTNWAAFQCDYDSPVQIQYSNENSGFILVGDTGSGHQMSFDHAGLTDDREYSFPDKSGTVALTSDIPTDTDTYRPIQVNGTQFLGNATSTGYANFKPGSNSNLTITGSNSHDIVVDVAANYSIPSTANQTKWTEKLAYVGTLGTGGTVTSLPSITTANIGDVYNVITDGVYNSQPAIIGDIFVAQRTGPNSVTWTWIPTGDRGYSGRFSCSYLNTLTTTTSNKRILNGKVYRVSDSGALNNASDIISVQAGTLVVFCEQRTDVTGSWGWVNLLDKTSTQSITGSKTFLNTQTGFVCEDATPIYIEYDNSQSGFLHIADGGDSGWSMEFDHAGLTNDQSYSFPDKSGIVALLDDITDAAVEIVDLTAL